MGIVSDLERFVDRLKKASDEGTLDWGERDARLEDAIEGRLDSAEAVEVLKAELSRLETYVAKSDDCREFNATGVFFLKSSQRKAIEDLKNFVRKFPHYGRQIDSIVKDLEDGMVW